MFAFGDKEWPGLAKLNEESGELVQVIGKLMMTHGDRRYWEGVDLRERLIEEMADQAAAIDFVSDHVLTPEEATALVDRMKRKRARFEQWHAEQAEPAQVSPPPSAVTDDEWLRAALASLLLRLAHVSLAEPITKDNLSGLSIPELVGVMDAAVGSLLGERAALRQNIAKAFQP